MENLQINDDYNLINHALLGIEINYFDNILEKTGIQKGVLASLLGIDPRTIDNYRKNNKRFNVLEGELLLKLGRLFDFGEDVFEDMSEFMEWLTANSIGLGNKRPLDLINTSTGVSLVSDELTRIEHGYVV